VTGTAELYECTSEHTDCRKKGVADSYKQFEMLPFDASNLSRTLSISTNRTKQLKRRKTEKQKKEEKETNTKQQHYRNQL